MRDVPAGLDRDGVTAWLASGMHVVHYPLRGGSLMNIAAFVEVPLTDRQRWPAQPLDWADDAAADPVALREAGKRVCAPLQALLTAVPRWAQWPLRIRLPLRSAEELAPPDLGPVALLGDAAHPMLPYLAQGAGMALEDAAELGHQLGDVVLRSRAVAQERSQAVPSALRAYAQARFARVARVQATAWRNGRIFHARAPLAWGRDLALRWAGPKLMAQDWLYQA
jgi:salicylate hydroxylase